jgi:Na+/proline symporter
MIGFRKLHRSIAPIIFLPLLLSAVTGLGYRLGKNWFGMSADFGDLMMVFHQGEFLGKPLVPIYVLLVGLGLLGAIITGLSMTKIFSRDLPKDSKSNHRKIHRILAPITFLPLAISAITGIIYRLGKSWFAMSDRQAAIFLRIHQGSYLGDFFKSIYILLIGLGLIAMLVTGINMTRIFRQRDREQV